MRTARPSKARVTLRPSEVECPSARCGTGGGPGRIELRGVPIDLLAFTLAELVGRPVVNQTGLEGLFDGSLEWAPTAEETQAVFGAPLNEARDPQAGASLFTALEEQLGLKLRDARAPIDTVVITRAERPVPD